MGQTLAWFEEDVVAISFAFILGDAFCSGFGGARMLANLRDLVQLDIYLP